jgi:hypothetical protein
VLEDIIIQVMALEVGHQAVNQVAFFEKKVTLELSFEAPHDCEVDGISDFDLGRHFD